MDGKTHRKIGTAAGAVVAFARSSPADDLWKRIAESVGGAIAGNMGARVPDWLEPAIHSHHRSTVHSIGFGAKVLTAAAAATSAWEESCRARATYFAERRREPTTAGVEWIKSFLGELFWRLAAGFISGASAGFGSHLVLDATTPRGLPVFIRGF